MIISNKEAYDEYHIKYQSFEKGVPKKEVIKTYLSSNQGNSLPAVDQTALEKYYKSIY